MNNEGRLGGSSPDRRPSVIANTSTIPVTFTNDTISVIFGITIITMGPSITGGYTSYGTSISCGNRELNTKIASAFTNPPMTLRG